MHLIDIVPLHVEQAKKALEKQCKTPIASLEIGNVCSLKWKHDQADACLLFGPLYHLTDKYDRLKVLQETYRVLKQNGIWMAVGISRFASSLDRIRNGCLKDPIFAKIVKQDLKNGQHRNPTKKPEYFMKTFFHHPDQLYNELEEAGFSQVSIYGVEGPGWLVQNFDEWWADNRLKQRQLYLARAMESEPSLLGINAHLIGVGWKS